MRLYINDVAVRDGFQMEKTFVPTATKIALVDELSETGLHKIEVTSFVSPQAVPGLADADAVLAGIRRAQAVTYVALVPNVRGVQAAVDTAARPDELNGVVSASEIHNRANINRTHAQSLAELPAMARLAHDAGMRFTMSLSTTFGCPFVGRIPEEVVLRFVEAFLSAGVDGISLADTTGMANPRQVEALCTDVLKRFPAESDTFYTLHFHNTRGMGLANVLAGIRAGVRSYDGSIAGLGGCPFAPGATGNICTEDLVNMLSDMGYDTGVDLDRLIQAARRVSSIVGHETPGQVIKAGTSLALHPIPEKLKAPSP